MSTLEIIFALLGSGGIGALISIIAGVIQNRRKSKTEQKGSVIEQSKETIDLVDGLLKKQLQWMAERMDSNDNVRKQEFDQLRTDLGGQLTDLQVENRRQNESIEGMSELLGDIKEYLNGGFAAFEQSKHATKINPAKNRKK